jgi:Fic family protein
MNYELTYEPLSKLFYKLSSKEEYEKEYQYRFNHPSSVHFDFEINGNPTFFIPLPSIYDKIIGIQELNYYIDNNDYFHSNFTVFAHLVMEKIATEVVSSNRIEGVVSTRKDVETTIEKNSDKSAKLTKQERRLQGLVKNYSLLINANKIIFETPEDIRKIYDDLLYEEISIDDKDNLPDGEIFRKESVDVRTITDKTIHQGLTPETKIIEYMQKALSILNGNLKLYFRVAIFHYLFGYIHPFYDGNGRTNRFISSSMLSNKNLFSSLYLSRIIEENKSAYYKAFEIVNDKKNKGDITPFVEMFVDIIYQASLRAFEDIYSGKEKLKKYTEIFDTLTFDNEKTKATAKIILTDTVLSDLGITKKELQRELNCSENTVKKALENIPEEFLITRKVGRTFKYLFNLEKLEELI